MRRKLTWVLVIGAAAVGIMAYAGNVFATPASGFMGTTIALGQFDDIDVFNQSFPPGFLRPWISIQKTKGPSDLYIQSARDFAEAFGQAHGDLAAGAGRNFTAREEISGHTLDAPGVG